LVSWPTAHRAFIAHADGLLGEPAPVRVLGIDETRRGKPRWIRCRATGRWRRVDPWDTGFVDLSGHQGVLGQQPGRTSTTVVDWLAQRSPGFRRPSRSWPSTRPHRMRRRSAPLACCPTPRLWSTTSTW
jgi:transposase